MMNFLWTAVSVFLAGCLIFAVGAFIVMLEILCYQDKKKGR